MCVFFSACVYFFFAAHHAKPSFHQHLEASSQTLTMCSWLRLEEMSITAEVSWVGKCAGVPRWLPPTTYHDQLLLLLHLSIFSG